MNEMAPPPRLVVDNKQLAPGRLKVTAVGHSPLFYWWPVWVLSFAFGLVTYFQVPDTYIESRLQLAERPAEPERAAIVVLSTSELGIVFCMVCGIVVLVANVSMQGWISFGVVGAILFATLLFAYLGWWDAILGFLDNQRVYMNSGFYFFIGTVILVPWLLVFFIFDRLSYWVFVPGQAIHKKLVGLGEQTYDISGMAIYKQRYDLFRHWILGLGSGDLLIATSGAKSREITLHNVLFLGSKIDKIQTLVAIKPDQFDDLNTGNAPQ